MKKNLLIIILMLITGYVSSQTLNESGVYSKQMPVSHKNASAPSVYAHTNPGGLPCDTTIFWGADNFGDIYEFHLNGNVVTNNGIVVSNCPSGCLAVGDNIALGNSYSPTFYSSNVYDSAYCYNGTSWIGLPGTADANHCPLYDAAAHGADLFYYYNNNPNCIYHYKNNGFTLIDTSTNVAGCVADIAVDGDNNVYVFLGASGDSVQYIKIITSTGELFRTYNFSMNTANAYGCFLLNKTLYIGLGASNIYHPNTLIPITFTFTTATAGTPISMPSLFLSDLASCVPGSPLAVASLHADDPSFTVYPNPVSDYLGFTLNSKGKTTLVVITDIQGRTVYQQEFKAQPVKDEFKINTTSFTNGCYFIRATVGGYSVTKKFVKI